MKKLLATLVLVMSLFTTPVLAEKEFYVSARCVTLELAQELAEQLRVSNATSEGCYMPRFGMMPLEAFPTADFEMIAGPYVDWEGDEFAIYDDKADDADWFYFIWYFDPDPEPAPAGLAV